LGEATGTCGMSSVSDTLKATEVGIENNAGAQTLLGSSFCFHREKAK
jgi:hypothetical protein